LKQQFRDAVRGKRDPRRSVYFDEVWNPYGIPPPGMPWKERDEDDSEGNHRHHHRAKSYLTFILWVLTFRMVYGLGGTKNTNAS